MSAPSPAPEQSPAPAGGIKQHLPFVIALVAGLAVGGASGMFVVGPAMATGIAPAGAPVSGKVAKHDADEEPDAAEEDEGEHGGDEEEDEESDGEQKEGGGTEMPVYTLDNLVLNPAQSGGTRFLLLSVTFEAKSADVVEKMKARDAELRDAVLVTIGARTVEQLAEMHEREALRAELKKATAKLFKKGAVKRIYFPQFVIQ